jgi:hypothetical protein
MLALYKYLANFICFCNFIETKVLTLRSRGFNRHELLKKESINLRVIGSEGVILFIIFYILSLK